MSSQSLLLLFSVAALFATPHIFCAGDTLIDASSRLHPFQISVQLPSSSQLLFYSISLASALAPGEPNTGALSRSVVHAALSAPVVLCSSNTSLLFSFSGSAASVTVMCSSNSSLFFSFSVSSAASATAATAPRQQLSSSAARSSAATRRHAISASAVRRCAGASAASHLLLSEV